MPPAIPDRWIQYKACGRIIEGTRLICFKVPLKRSVQTGNKEIWDIDALKQNIPLLGAVIDLTNTDRYYKPEELRAAGVLHRKILMPGRLIPPESKVTGFMDTVDEFLRNNCESLVGVHCTHGLNRTGYMVCRYMRDRLGISGKDAIKRFEKARGYKIERENYIADILGKAPLPPDVGGYTELKPLKQQSRSSLKYQDSEYVDTKDDTQHQERFSRRERFDRDNSRSKGTNYNWRARPEQSSSTSFDYRHDY